MVFIEISSSLCWLLGNIEGNTKIKKEYPASNEHFIFKGYKNEHFINTKEFGQIAVAICYENHLRYRFAI